MKEWRQSYFHAKHRSVNVAQVLVNESSNTYWIDEESKDLQFREFWTKFFIVIKIVKWRLIARFLCRDIIFEALERNFCGPAKESEPNWICTLHRNI